MSSTARQNNLLLTEDWQKIYQSFRNADFQSYDFENLRRVMIDYLRTNYPEDFNDYIESSEYLALIDLIAYIGQSIAFRVDLNARENFLELAERRDSILRLARLISYNPKRNIAATGLMKFNTVSTTESVLDSNGRNLAGQFVTWNDPSNPNWYDQFIKVINAALPTTQQFGNPVDQASIYGVQTAQYRFNATNNDVPIHSFTKTIAGRSMDFEITSTTFNGKTYIYEEAPKIGNKIACIYSDDGFGASSPNTGFFFHVTQGTLNQGTFTINQPSSNEVIDISAQNINNSDIWLYGLNSNGLENALWQQVPALAGNNIIYNSLTKNIKDIYSVITRVGDAVTLSFSDGTFGSLPLGAFRVYYRVSNGLTYTINTSDIRNVTISIPYTSEHGQDETLTISLSLASSVTNATVSESNTSVKTNAPQLYYTQNRMITGEDYNISPLTVSQQISKVKALNRSSSGISRYFDLIDPTGKYSSTNLFSDDGIIYRQDSLSATTFTFATKTDIQNVLYNTVADLMASPNLRNFFYANYVDKLSVSIGSTYDWVAKTVDSNTSTGYIRSGISPAAVGPVYGGGDLKYVAPGALIKFTAPEGYSFNTKSNNKLVAQDTTKAGLVQYIWAEVVSVSGDGTANNTGELSTGYGPITLNKVIPNPVSGAYPYITQVIPEFNTVISRATQTTIIDLVFTNTPFGLRYDAPTQTWQIIFESNLNASGNFSLGNSGDVTNTRADASWLLLFTTNNEYYTITSRTLRYVFESDTDVTFYFDKNTKIYDSVSSSIVNDEISVLSINNKPGTTSPFTQDMKWEIVSEYIGLDGYVDPKKVVVSFADTDNNGIVDNPQSFLDIVYNDNSGEPTYVVQKKYVISDGQEDYKYVYNDPSVGPVIIALTEALVGSPTIYDADQHFYIVDQQVVKKYNSSGALVPSLDYKVFIGRDLLRFQYTHSADYDSRIDPGTSNIMDVYVLTNDYDTQFRQWLSGSNVLKPKPPSSDQLNSMLASSLDPIKAMSDEVIYHPVQYRLLFGPGADESLQASFNVIMNPNSTSSEADVTARILSAINQFFALANWDFGDTFYFTELSTYVMNQLAPDVTNFVIVPKRSGQYFGSLFEIKCPSNEIFLSSATAAEINVVSGLTSTNLKTVTGVALDSVSSQQITSANYGASN
jgi:hypothetical protein